MNPDIKDTKLLVATRRGYSDPAFTGNDRQASQLPMRFFHTRAARQRRVFFFIHAFIRIQRTRQVATRLYALG